MKKILQFQNESHTVSGWAKKLNLTSSVIKNRLHRNWSIEKTLSTPRLRNWKIYHNEHILKARWRRMIARCEDPKAKDYERYGAKGITVCNRWHNFDSFLEDMESTFKVGLTIERIDNTKGYSKENCIWADYYIQANHTKRNKYITYQGVTKTLTEWARHFNIKQSTMSMRYYKYKWSIEKCFTYRKAVV